MTVGLSSILYIPGIIYCILFSVGDGKANLSRETEFSGEHGDREI